MHATGILRKSHQEPLGESKASYSEKRVNQKFAFYRGSKHF